MTRLWALLHVLRVSGQTGNYLRPENRINRFKNYIGRQFHSINLILSNTNLLQSSISKHFPAVKSPQRYPGNIYPHYLEFKKNMGFVKTYNPQPLLVLHASEHLKICQHDIWVFKVFFGQVSFNLNQNLKVKQNTLVQ